MEVNLIGFDKKRGFQPVRVVDYQQYIQSDGTIVLGNLLLEEGYTKFIYWMPVNDFAPTYPPIISLQKNWEVDIPPF